MKAFIDLTLNFRSTSKYKPSFWTFILSNELFAVQFVKDAQFISMLTKYHTRKLLRINKPDDGPED